MKFGHKTVLFIDVFIFVLYSIVENLLTTNYIECFSRFPNV